jgi:Leucine-rich repeat (LRR) protein
MADTLACIKRKRCRPSPDDESDYWATQFKKRCPTPTSATHSITSIDENVLRLIIQYTETSAPILMQCGSRHLSDAVLRHSDQISCHSANPIVLSRIYDFKCIVQLSLSGTACIGSYAVDFGKLKHLETLTMRHCGLSQLPHSLPPALLRLNLSNNPFGEPPLDFGHLEALEELCLSSCKLSCAPVNLSPSVQVLEMDRNSLGDALLDFRACVRLKELNLDACGLADLHFIPLLPASLTALRVEYNHFQKRTAFDMRHLPLLDHFSVRPLKRAKIIRHDRTEIV